MRCPDCGAELQENAVFCLYCMKSLEKKTQLTPVKKRKRRWQIVLAILAVLAMIVVLIFMLRKPKKEKTFATTAVGDSVAQQSEAPISQATTQLPVETVSQEPQTEEVSQREEPTQPRPTQTEAQTEPTAQPTQTECEHVYREATCIAPLTCMYCGDTVGVALQTGHRWENEMRTVHHEEVGHYEDVFVRNEKVIAYGCAYCSAEVDSFEELTAHFQSAHRNIDNYEWHLAHLDSMFEQIERWVPLYETQWIVDRSAYDETIVTGRKCSICGKTEP